MKANIARIVTFLLILVVFLTACGGAGPETAPAESDTEESAAPEANQGAAEEEASEAPADEEASEAEPAESAASGEPITLKMMVVDYVQDTTDKWLEEEVVPAFQEQHPNVNVEFIYVNWGTLDETVQGYFAAGEGADIINLGSEYVAIYGDQLAPLNDYLGEAAWPDIKEFAPGTLDTVIWEGELRGLP
ncbi:MAG: extracellular solute-binding protein, partial [Ardenticatenaceae bacterium]